MIDEKLLENLEDAQMALLMDAYAKAEGEALMAESELLEEPMSEEFKAQCLRLIDREFAKRRRKKRYRAAARNTAKAALVAFALIALLSVGIMSVEAIRVPVLNFFLEHKEKFTTIFFTPTDPVDTTREGMVQEGPLAGLLPDTYKMDSYNELPNGNTRSVYLTDANKFIMYSARRWENASMSFDTENVDLYEEKELLGHHAFLIVKEQCVQILWINEENNLLYSMSTDNMTPVDFWALAQMIALNK